MFAGNSSSKHLKFVQNAFSSSFRSIFIRDYVGGDGLTRARETKGALTAPNRTANAEGLSTLALKGLFLGFGHCMSDLDTQGGLQDERADDIADLAQRLCVVADIFGTILRDKTTPNNQFALFNLAYPSRFAARMKQTEVEDVFDTASGKPSLSLNGLADAICTLRRKLETLAAHHDDTPTDEKTNRIASTLTKYFTRQNFAMNERAHYGFILFFHIGLARELQFDFDDDEVLQASPAVLDVFTDGLAMLHRADTSPEALLEALHDTLERGQASRDSTVFLGGLTEVGKADFRSLWDPLFGQNKKDHKTLSQGMSLQRHFVCYRLTSSIERIEVLKSFMVLQSPGRLKEEPHLRRKHFAMKVYTQYDATLVRSVGAVLPLGNEIVGFASRREMQEDDKDRTSEWLDPTTFRGATMLIFGDTWFKSKRGLLLGMLTTTNKDRRNISCPVLCIQTDKDHSGHVALDVIMKQDLVSDMLQHTRLQALEAADEDGLTEYAWSLLWATYQGRLALADAPENGSKLPPVMARSQDPGSVRRDLLRLGYTLDTSN